MSTIKLWGFNGSTYVRTVRMLLAEKGVRDYEQIPLNVLEGEPKRAENLERHPFGKVPVVEIDGFRVIETPAITRYLDVVLPGKSLIPSDAKDAARMDMAISIIDSYGYGALLAGVAGYHLFPDFVGGKNEKTYKQGIKTGKLVLETILKNKGEARFLAGRDISIADLYLAPIVAYITMTPVKDEFLALPGVGTWWGQISNTESFKSTQP